MGSGYPVAGWGSHMGGKLSESLRGGRWLVVGEALAGVLFKSKTNAKVV